MGEGKKDHMTLLVLSLMLTVMVASSVIGVRLWLHRASRSREQPDQEDKDPGRARGEQQGKAEIDLRPNGPSPDA